MRPAIVIGALAAVAIGVAIALRSGMGRLDSVVASTVERYGTVVTGTDVRVDSADLALTAGRANFSGLTVDNPGGYETDYAVRVASASVELDVASLAGDVPVVEEIVLDGALINAEQRDAASNLTDIQKHATASPDESPSAEPGRIIVERFRVRNARVLLTSEHLSKLEELPLSDIVVADIGTATGGATYSEAAEAMLMPIVAAARSAAAERLRVAAADAVSDAAREELEEETDELGEATDEARQEVSEKLEELLDRG